MNNFPDFYDPDRVGTLFYPDMAQIAEAARDANLPPASLNNKQVHLVIIDMQIDFCHEEGTLYVPGAVDDLQRLINFIFSHARYINKITCTLDSHLPFQIFHPSWWVDAEGNQPDPLTNITAADIQAGQWHPTVMREYSANYVRQLENQAKKQLTIWPYHVLIGSPGNMLDPMLWSTVMWHALARRTQPSWLPKGMIPQTEHYSAVKPEIPVKHHPQSGKNQVLLDSLAKADVVLVAGEAKSHCVLETLQDIVAEFRDEPGQLEKIYVLQDCMSSVHHPEIDFHALAEEQFKEWAGTGMNFIDSTNPAPFLEAVVLEAEAELAQ